MASTPITVFQPRALGADYLNPAYGPAAHGEGARVHFRYLKNLTAAEVAAGHARGDGFVAIAEGSSQDPIQGSAVGLWRGAEAVNQAQALGYPQGCPILIAVDTNPADLTACEAYFRAAAALVKAAGFQVGFYGGSRMWWRVRDIVDVTCRAAAGSWSPASIIWAPDVVQGTQEPSHRWDWDFIKAPLNVWLPRFIPDPVDWGLYPLNPNKPTLRVPTSDARTGGSVTYCQNVLNHVGIPVHVDGQYGPQSASGVKTFQRNNSLFVDGVVGPQTWAALDKATQS